MFKKSTNWLFKIKACSLGNLNITNEIGLITLLPKVLRLKKNVHNPTVKNDFIILSKNFNPINRKLKSFFI